LNPAFAPGAIITSNGGLYPGIDGQAAEFINFGQPTTIHVRRDSAVVLGPTPQQNVVLSADIFDDGMSPKRITFGVRFFPGTTAPLNLVQLGMPLFSGPFYAHRAIGLFDPVIPSFVWNAFSLPDHMNEPFEVGPGWHRFKATITMHELIYSLDLYRDGVVDAVDVVPGTVHPFGFNDLRFGLMGPPITPSFVAIDNISLRYVPVPEPASAAGLIAGLGVAAAVVRGLRRRP
jgi:hypothetical protein